MCKYEGEKNMDATVEKKREINTSQSNTFFKLRQEIQNEMKRTNTKYEDVQEITESIKHDE